VKEAIPTIPPNERRLILPAAEDRSAQIEAAAGHAAEAPAIAYGSRAPEAIAANARHEVDIKKLLSTKRAEDTTATGRANLLMEETEDWAPVEEGAFAGFDIASIAPMGRIFAAYILGHDADSFYFIDQHAAHERVLYERFLRQHRDREKLCQQLLAPIVIELPHAARATAPDEGLATRAFLAALGYEAEDFGANACKVNAVPAFMPLSEAEDFLHLLLAELPEGRAPKEAAAVARVISAACKAAVKAGDRLGDAEIARLFSDLAACENPYACPHGRPVFLRLTKRDVERLFKRR
jgi:DNA mismatch repair protein MutL